MAKNENKQIADAAGLEPALEETLIDSSTGDREHRPDYEELHAVKSDHYVVGAEIARGGMGRILEAHDRRAGRTVAIKEVLLELLKIYPDDERELLLRRFEREARITARLEHPSIVPVYEIGRLDNAPFFAMKKVDGQPLDDLIDERATLADRIRLLPTVISVCEALGYAHDRGVVHRDLKPSNILVGEHGETVVIDWGLAKQIGVGDDEEESDEEELSIPPVLTQDDGLRTVVGSVFGTPLYMAPEQAHAEPVDRRADVYALGSILYHTLSGKAPYTDGSKNLRKSGILEALKDGPPTALEEVCNDLPPDLLSIVEKAMARDKADRYSSAAELAADLRNFEAGKLVAVHRYSTRQLVWRWLKRHRAVVTTAAIAVVALLVVAFLLFEQVRSARDRAEEHAAHAIENRERATRLFTEMGRKSFLSDEMVSASFALIRSDMLGAQVPGLDRTLADVEAALDGLIYRSPPERKVTDFAFADDADVMAVSYESGVVDLIDMREGVVRRSHNTGRPVGALAVNRDATLLFSLPRQGDAIVWDLQANESVQTFGCKDKDSLQLAVPTVFIAGGMSLDGRQVAIGCPNRVVTLYDVESGKATQSFKLGFPISGIKFSEDGTRVGVIGTAGMLAIILIEEAKIEAEAALGLGGNTNISIDPSLRHATSMHESEIRVHLLSQGSHFVVNDNADRIQLALLSPDQTRLFTAEHTGYVGILNVKEQKVVKRWKAHPRAIEEFSISRDARSLATLGEDLVLRVWDASSGRLRSSLLGATEISTPYFNRRGDRLALLGRHHVTLFRAEADLATEVVGERSFTSYSPTSKYLRIDTQTKSVLRETRTGVERPLQEAWDPGRTGGFNGTGELVTSGTTAVSTATLDRQGVPPKDVAKPSFVLLSSDGSTMAGLSYQTLSVWDRKTGQVLWSLERKGNDGPGGAMLSSDGKVVVVMRSIGVMSFVDISTGEMVDHKLGSMSRILSDHRGHRLVLREGITVGLWDVSAQRRIAMLDINARHLALSSDGTLLAASDRESREIHIFDAQNGAPKQVINLGPLTKPIDAVAINGGFVAAANSDSEVLVWDATSGRLILRRLIGERANMLSLAPDGSEMAVAVPDRVLIYGLRRASMSAGELLLRLAKVYPTSFFVRNFPIE